MNDKDHLIESFNRISEELSQLAHVHIKLLKKFRRCFKRLREGDEEEFRIILQRLRILRSRVRLLLEELDDISRREELNNKISSEEIIVLLNFFEMSSLRDEKRFIEKVIKLKPEYTSGLTNDLREIEYLSNLALRLYSRSK